MSPEMVVENIAATIRDRGQAYCGFCGSNLGPGTAETHPCHTAVMEWRNERKETSMANVVICDPCGTVTAARAAGACTYRPNGEDVFKDYTLCADCSEKVYDVLHPQGPRATPILRGFDPSARAQDVVNKAETTRAALEAEYGESA